MARYGMLCLGLLSVLAFAYPGAKAASPSEVFKRAEASIVVVKTKSSQGSGVVIHDSDVAAWIATNCHVLGSSPNNPVEISRHGRTAEANLIFIYEAADICLLGTRYRGLKAATLRLERPKVGERVYSVGAPRGLESTLAEGLVSQIREDDRNDRVLIQTTASISPGSSGGGLFDNNGRLLGITTFQLRDSDGLNFAVSAFSLQWALDGAWAALVLKRLGDLFPTYRMSEALLDFQFLFLRDSTEKRFVSRLHETLNRYPNLAERILWGKPDPQVVDSFWTSLGPILSEAEATLKDKASLGPTTEDRWLKIFESKQFSEYLDTASVSREGHLTFASTLSEFRDEGLVSAFGQSAINRKVADCNARTVALVAITSYSGTKGNGEVLRAISREKTRWQFDPISRAGSPNAGLLNSLCSKP